MIFDYNISMIKVVSATLQVGHQSHSGEKQRGCGHGLATGRDSTLTSCRPQGVSRQLKFSRYLVGLFLHNMDPRTLDLEGGRISCRLGSRMPGSTL